MALTDHCDLFASFHEDGFNRIIEQVMLQRPSFFHYATPDLVKTQRLCQDVAAHPAVSQAENPLIKQIDYLPIIGYDGPFGFSFSLQLTDLKIDFHPGNVIDLPPQLNPPLADQELALTARACAGLGCPDPEFIDRLIRLLPDPDEEDGKKRNDDDPKPPLNPMPYDKLTCFCLEVFAVVKAVRQDGYLSLRLQDMEIKDILPAGLENSIECYLSTMLKLVVFPKIRIALEELTFEITDYLSVGPTPISADVPFNPDVSQDQVAIFANLI